jgi:hypothetical protein
MWRPNLESITRRHGQRLKAASTMPAANPVDG